MRAVHKDPLLDLVGWYSLVPKTGPTPQHLPIHTQISSQNESAILLGFHIEDILNPAAGDPLPLTIYESNNEVVDSTTGGSTGGDGEDKEMKDISSESKLAIRFRELPYSTETGEAEMIAMQFVRVGGANALAVDPILEQFDKKIAVDVDGKTKRRAVADEQKQQQWGKGKGKGKAADAASSSSAAAHDQTSAKSSNRDANLSKAEAEYMSALQAKYNAIKMMKSRVDLIVAYLQNLPPAFLAGNQTSADAAAQSQGGRHTLPSNNILRQIQALVTNVELATPTASSATKQKQQSGVDALQKEILRETNDVHLVSLIADLMASVNEVREVGKKFSVVESARNHKAKHGDPRGLGGGFGGSGSSGNLLDAPSFSELV